MADARAVALEIIRDVEDGAFLNLSIKKKLECLSAQDRRFCARLCSSVIQNLTKIDYVIDYFTKGKRVHRLIRDILRLGVCQLMFFSGVPESAAVNECVKLAARSPKRQLKGFVNAVLHTVAVEKENVVYPDKSDVVRYMSVMYSYPEWLVKKYIGDYGEGFTEKMLSYENPALTCIRANRIKISPADLDKKLSGFESARGKYVKDARYVKNLTSIEELDEYKSGELTVQGEASMLVVEAADIKEGMSVLDVCAAPGGKSAYAAGKKPGYILACDIHPHRVELMKKNFQRLGVEAETRVMDASVPQGELYGKFDRVIVDAPCSALGLLYRKPDIKYRKSGEDIRSIIEIQREILETASRYVKKGGLLVYSTCTINKDENDVNADDFLSRHADFIEHNTLSGFNIKSHKGGRVQLFPHEDGMDGFFICVMERKQ